MAKIDFTEIMTKQVGSAPAPKPVPEGTYHGEIVGVPTLRTVQTKEGEKPIATITIAMTEAGDDVAEDELSEAGGLLTANGEPKRIRHDYWLTEDSLWRYDQLFENLGISEGSYADAGEQLAGRAVTLFIKVDTYTGKNGERTVNNVQRLIARE